MELFQLIYSSHAVEGLALEQVEALQAFAQTENEKLSLTGVLLYDGQHFIQVLEGEEATVTALYERIKRDRRHEGVRLILQRRVDAREFPNWGMGFRNVQNAEPLVLEWFSDLVGAGYRTIIDRLEGGARSPATFLLRAFLDIA